MKNRLLISRILIAGSAFLVAAAVPKAEAETFPFWPFNKKLTASDAEDGDKFGRNLDSSGDIVIVAAPREDGGGSDRGAAYLINYVTGQELHKLTASDAEDDDRFGRSVAISGNRAVVATSQKDGSGTEQGQAYIFNVSTGAEENILTPSVVQDSALFGYSCAIEGNYVAVGQPGGDVTRGAAYLFNATTGAEIFRLIASDRTAGDLFGSSVAVTEDYVIVGALGEGGSGSNRGKVYVFDINTGDELFTLTPSTVEDEAYFGASAAAEGDYLVVGAFGENGAGTLRGAAYLFDLSSETQIRRLAPPSEDEVYFGFKVSISDCLAVVGASHQDFLGTDRGAAYVYDVETGNLLRRTFAPDGVDFTYYGIGVCAADGYVLAGADQEITGSTIRGAVYVHEGSNVNPLITVATASPVIRALLIRKIQRLLRKVRIMKRKDNVKRQKILRIIRRIRLLRARSRAL